MNKLAGTVVSLRIPIIIVTVVVTVVLGFFSKDIRINPDIMGYLPKDDPVTVLNDYISETYGGSRLAVVALESEDVFTRRTLETVDQLTERFRLIEGIRYVTSLTNIIDIRKVDDWLEVGKLIDPTRFPLQEQELQNLRAYTLGKEMYSGRLVSSDGKATVIVCKLEEGTDEAQVVAEIRKTVSDADPADKVYFAGLPFQLEEISTLVVRDLIRLIPLTVLLIIASLYIGLRSLRGVLLPLLSALISSVWVIGIMSLFEVAFSVISNIIPVVLIAVGSAYSIHVVNSFSEIPPDSSDRRSQSRRALSRVALPVILAALTTVAGFTAFVFGSYLGMIKEFGIFSALGILFSLIISLTFVPSVLSLLRPLQSPAASRRPESGSADDSANRGAFFRLGGWLVRRHRAVFAATAALVGISVVGMPLIRREVDILSYFKRDTQIRISEQMMQQRFGGSTTLQILVKGNIQDPKVLQKMKEMENLLRSREELHNVYSVVELIEAMNDAMVDERTIPDSEAQVANLWFLLEGEESLYQLVNETTDEAVIQATMESMNTRVMSELIQVIRSRIETLEGPEVSFQLGGFLIMFNALDEAVRRSQIQSLLVAVALIFLCNLFLLRSVAGSLIGLIPIMFTLFILFGAMGLSGIPLDIVTVLLGSISLGVGVDYSIHFLSRLRDEFRLSGQREGALVNTLGTTGKAIAVNMGTVSLGFVSLVFGTLLPIRRFALLMLASMLGAGVGALLVLPSIMMMSSPGIFRTLVQRVRLFGGSLRAPRRLSPAPVASDPDYQNDQTNKRGTNK
ncbi:MAG: RND family transporter [Spirochaetales bacterium]|nr:RND family transporter [Spirochaetales bacterium]